MSAKHNDLKVSTEKHENSDDYIVVLRWRDQKLDLPFVLDKVRAEAMRGQVHRQFLKLFALNGGAIINGCKLEEVRW